MKQNTPYVQTIALALLIGGGILFWSWQKKTEPDSIGLFLQGGTMGTYYQVSLASKEKCSNPRELKQEIDQLLDQLSRQMSTYLPDSEISKFNQSDSTDWVTISPEFLQVVKQSLDLAQQTEGSFDPTIALLVNLWHFGPEKQHPILPTKQEIALQLKRVGYQKLQVQDEPPAIKKEIPELQLDLSAIAKGDAVDRLARLLQQKNYANFLVNIGGEVVAAGEKSPGQPWLLGIEKPVENERKVTAIVALKHSAMATSGDYRNYYRIEDKKFSHTISPQTGQPVTHTLHSVSVIAPTCAQADAFATAMMVMGPEKAWQFAQQQNLNVFLIYEQNDKLISRKTDTFPVITTKE